MSHARSRAIFSTLLLIMLLTAAKALAGGATPDVDFSRDIRPILASNCLKCHGVDDKARKGNLRLDMRESATAAAKSGDRPIVPGKPEQSALIRRINSTDPDEQMPPPSTKIVLSAAQKKQLKQWIAAGAEYAPHWAFVAPKAAPLPAVKDQTWCRNAIDFFVLAKLEKEGLHPSPEADKLTLCRRVYLDLIGLPPTPEQADAFAKDSSPDAYEKLVDGLLASPAYGERWARRWLDLARYSDTNGYEKDRQRSIWPYRDWVINALNADVPFDEFTIEQLAGDMLPNATPAQKIATGFHRNTMLNEEGGIDPLEYRYYAMVDRVSTTSTTWLGLTIACAQCHTHKYDPILNREYYKFMALLDNASEPEMEVPSPDIIARQKEIEGKVARLAADLPRKFAVNSDGVKWTSAGGKFTAASGATANLEPDNSWRLSGVAPDRDTYTIEFDTPAGDCDRIRLEAIREGDRGPGLTHHGNFVLSEFSAMVRTDDAASAAPVKLVRAQADFSQASFPVEHAIDGNLATGWAIDGPGGVKSRSATFFFDKPIRLDHAGHWIIKLEQNYGEQHVLGHFRLSLGSPVSDGRSIEMRRQEALQKAFAAWEKRASASAVKWMILRPDAMASSKPILTVQKDDSVLASGDITKRNTYDLTFRNAPAGITAVRLEALPDDSLPKHGPGMVFYEGAMGDFSLSEITLTAAGKNGKFIKADQSYAADGGSGAAAAIDGNPQTGWMINGGQGRAHQAIFILDKPTQDTGDFIVHLLFERYFAAALGHFRISITSDSRAKDDKAMPPDVELALATAAEQRTAEQRDCIFNHYLQVAPELAVAREEINRLRDSAPKPPTTLVMRERLPGQQRVTHVHHRGAFLDVEDAVTGDVPAFLPPLPGNVPHDRLALARWLVSPENPLTARVTVNRQWQAFFGRGIVSTTGDFGYQGDLPTHPDLLDWLAIEFMKPSPEAAPAPDKREPGHPAPDAAACSWSMKKLDRLIVMSATYRQSSRVTPELFARDPQNLLLARGPRFRVDAEIVRDSALKSSGLLTEKIGGPSVFPPQPASVTTEGAYGPMQWNASTGADRYRRSLYTFSKRTAPFAMYVAFDAPAGDVCTGRRDVSNSPLQALTVLNDAIFVECAQAMGKSVAGMKDAKDKERAAEVFRRCLTRQPSTEELSALVSFAKSQRERIAAKELSAEQIAGGREGDVNERAVWTTVSRAVMNLAEAVTKN